MAIFQEATGVTAGTTTLITLPEPVRCSRHQIDVMGPTAGSMAVTIDFGAGERAVGEIDFTDAARVPFVIEAELETIKLVPTGLNAAYTYCHRAEERR